MKHRAAGRLAKKRIEVILSLPAMLDAVGEFINRATDFIVDLADRVAKVFMPPHPLEAAMAGRSPIIMNIERDPAAVIGQGHNPMAMSMLTRPQDWAPPARATLWPEHAHHALAGP